MNKIYQECKTTSDFTKEFKALEKELDKKKNKKMDELKSLFTYKPETEHRQCFDKILEEISQYDSQLEYWSNIGKLKGNVIYPLYYEVNVPIDIPSIEHGYLLIGGAYVEDVITGAVFEIVDTEGKIYEVTDSLARTLGVKLQVDVLVEKEPDNQKILAYIDKITDYMKQNSIIFKKARCLSVLQIFIFF